MDLENLKEYVDVSLQQATGYHKDYIGDGIAGNDVPIYLSNSHSQNTHYYNKSNSIMIILIIMTNGNENENDQYIMDSLGDNSNRQPYERKCVLGNLGDCPSIEEFTIKNN